MNMEIYRIPQLRKNHRIKSIFKNNNLSVFLKIKDQKKKQLAMIILTLRKGFKIITYM